MQAYIDSGILEQFVLGNTSPKETAKIIELSDSHPEIKAEIEAIEEGLIKFAEVFAKKPSDSVKDKLMAKLDSEELNQSTKSDNERELNLNPLPLKSRSIPFYKYFIAASILLLGMSLIGNIWLYKNWKSSQNQVASLSSQNTFLTDNNKTQEAKYSVLENKVNILLNPEVKSVKLNGLPLMPQAVATVYWNASEKEVYLTAANLPENSENEQYQLWAIVDGKPVDAGVFNTSEALKGMVKMKNAGNVSAFAVTIEKRGGAISPTMEKMVLMGAVI